jgi:hypothetical protein
MDIGRVRKARDILIKKKRQLTTAQMAELEALPKMFLGPVEYVINPKHGNMPKSEWIKKKISRSI